MTIEELQELPGVGPATAQALVAVGFVDRAAIAAGSIEDLVVVRGVGEAKAAALIGAAQISALDQEAPSARPAETDPDAGVTLPSQKEIERLRSRHAELKKRAKKARKRAKAASSKKKRKRWTGEADRLAKRAKKAKKRLAELL